MKKSELLKRLAIQANVNQLQADAVLGAFTMVLISEVLLRGDVLVVPGLGTFKQHKAAARIGNNPQTGAPMNIPARTSLKFYMSSTLK